MYEPAPTLDPPIFPSDAPWQIGLGSFLVMAAMSLVDDCITVNLELSVFYVLPIAALTWYVQPRWGYLSGITSAMLC